MSDDKEDIGRPGKRARLTDPISDAASQVFALLGFADDEYQTPQQATFGESRATLLRHIISQSDDPLETHRQLIATNRTLQDWARANPGAYQEFMDSLLKKKTIMGDTMYSYDGNMHRTGGPAEYGPGWFKWWNKGIVHRSDGPAMRKVQGAKTFDIYYINGRRVRRSDYNTDAGTSAHTYFNDREIISREQAEVMYAQYPAILEEHQTPPPQ